MTHFDRLGLRPTYALDADRLERAYLARSRELHPDYHSSAASAEQRASLELTAALNDAYATLKHPFLRAEYLLSLHDGPTCAEHRQMDPAFLEEMLDLRMAIADLPADPESPARTGLARKLDERRALLLADIADRFAKLESSADRGPLLLQMRQLLNAAKYIQGLLRDLHAD